MKGVPHPALGNWPVYQTRGSGRAHCSPITHVGVPTSISDLLDTLQLSSEDPYRLEQHVRTQKSEVIDVGFA